METIADLVTRLLMHKGFIRNIDTPMSVVIGDKNSGVIELEYKLENRERLDIRLKDIGRTIVVLGKHIATDSEVQQKKQDDKIIVFYSIESDDIEMISTLKKLYDVPSITKFKDMTFRYFPENIDEILDHINEFESVKYRYVKNLKELMIKASSLMGVNDLGIENGALVSMNEKYKAVFDNGEFRFGRYDGKKYTESISVRHRNGQIIFYSANMEKTMINMEHRFARRPGEEIIARDYNEVLRFFKELYKK